MKTNDEMLQVKALIASLLAEKAEILLRLERAASGSRPPTIRCQRYSALRKKRIAGNSTAGMGASGRTGAGCSPGQKSPHTRLRHPPRGAAS